ncbi:Integrase core domain containing protein [Histomonas meleagridis]|uniref:Integrase core domain containing protein n=1 Tax=Histomonas meleagridis TaxID=135588 RepID=UPI00355A7EC4|nr:Integrase core domain containing protein [Histomonas meleagridis]KAH0805911.1 Integrase core domain containing protein [Histomonas meleagridis]
MKAGRKAMKFDTDWLIQTAVDIENGVTTLMEASKNAKIVQKDRSGFTRIRTQIVSPGAIKRGFEKLGLKVDFRRGRRETVILEQFRGTILSVQKESGMGATKIYEQLVAKAPNNQLFKKITHNMVYKTLKSNSLMKYTKPNQVPQKQRCRYEADNPDLIWHTDLHHFDGQYLIAFIDDYSRYVVHHELIPTKDFDVIKTVLEIAIQYRNRPYCIWTDNGTEF